MAVSHIDAEPGEIADIVLMPGDPLRGERIAQRSLADARCHNRARNMLGYTGTVHGVPVSVQASGMGSPSMAIYATELVDRYGVRTIVRVGTCAAVRDDLELGDLIIALGAASDSRINEQWIPGVSYSPVATFEQVAGAADSAARRGLRAHVGQIMSSDVFYHMDAETLIRLEDMGILALDMETAALYGVAARHGARALSVLTVSDRLGPGPAMSREDRESTFANAVAVALDAALAGRMAGDRS